MLVATAVWLFYRRLLYGPLLLLVWWPLRTIVGTGVKVGNAVGRLGGGGGLTLAASMVVDSGGSGARVVGMTEGAVPTVEVAGGSKSKPEADDPDSMVETVGKIVDGGQDPSQLQRELGDSDQPNPMKRMWEEDVEVAKQAERLRDEL